MAQPIARVGDKTSHGGTVSTGSTKMMVGGQMVACVGDSVPCAIAAHNAGGPPKITSGSPKILLNGKPVAVHGSTTSCGATLIATTPKVSA